MTWEGETPSLDLILIFGKKVIAVECKATKSPKLTRGFWNAVEDVQHY